MDRNYTVQTKINCSVDKAFEAVVNKDIMTEYFADQTDNSLVEGATVVWNWSNWGDHPVTVKRVVANSLIELELDSKVWKKTPEKSYPVTVTMEFESLGEDSMLLKISESGWLTDETGLKGSHDNCSGWTHMAMCLKGYLEHGLDMRK